MCKIKSDFTCYDDTEKHYKMMLVIWKFGSIITWTSPVAKTLGDYNLLWSWCSQPGVFSRESKFSNCDSLLGGPGVLSRESKFSNCDSLLGGPGVPRQCPGIHRQYPGSTTEFREAPGTCLGPQRRFFAYCQTNFVCHCHKQLAIICQ